MSNVKHVRPFALADVPRLRRLAPLGVSLDIVTKLTRGVNPINAAFWASLPLGQMGMPTYVLRDSDARCLGLLRHREGAPQAYIAYLAPDLDQGADPTHWLELVEGLVQAAGERGAHILNAEVDPGSQTFVALREAGFAVFARQEVWRLTSAPAVEAPVARLRPCTDADSISVTALYVNMVPRLVQQAISPPEAGDRGLVYCNEQGHAAGYFAIFEGQRGILLRPLLHPEVYEQAVDLIADALRHLAPSDRTPVYCAVHSYQEWLHEPLAAAGFALWARQAVMGKYTLRRVEDPAFQPLSTHPLAMFDKKPPPVPEAKTANNTIKTL